MRKFFQVAVKVIAPVCLVCNSLSSYAVDGYAGLDLSLSNETANIGVYSLRETTDELTVLGADYFFNQPGDNFIDVFGSISRKGIADNPNLEVGVKGKVFYVNQDRDEATGYGVMLGATARYWLPTEFPVSIAGDFLYGPPIVVFEDAENAVEYEIRGEFQILPSAVAYVGFRNLTVDFDQRNNHELDKNVHIGVNVAFQ